MASPAAKTFPVILSVAMATGSQQRDEEPLKRGVVIKNTFIDVEEDGETDRNEPRSSSAPPPVARGIDDEQLEERRSLPKCMLSSPNVNALQFRIGDWAAESETPENSPRGPPSMDDLSTDWNASGSDSDEKDSSDNASVSSSSNSSRGVGLTLAQLIPVPEPRRTPLRASLKSCAKSYVPAHQMAAPLNTAASAYMPISTGTAVPPDVRKAFAQVVAAGLAALKSCSATDVNEHASGWTLHGYVQPELMYQSQNGLSLVQDSMMQAAQNSENVYLVGYEAEPFQPMQQGEMGFTAKLVIVADESSACWDHVGKGFCRRGCACRWMHPQWEVDISVQMMSTY